MPRPRMRPRARIWQVMISFPFLESLVQLVLNLEGAVRRKVSALRRARLVARRRCCSHCHFPLSLSLPFSLFSISISISIIIIILKKSLNNEFGNV